jgi:hypothetical protein
VHLKLRELSVSLYQTFCKVGYSSEAAYEVLKIQSVTSDVVVVKREMKVNDNSGVVIQERRLQ